MLFLMLWDHLYSHIYLGKGGSEHSSSDLYYAFVQIQFAGNELMINETLIYLQIEVNYIGQLHPNLVKLIGTTWKETRLLVYEFMPKGSKSICLEVSYHNH